jgi:hypothetical protein
LVAAFLFIGNFAVANLNLAAYVDSAVNCMLMAIVWSMLTNRWWLLPLWGMMGGVAKETFVPMCVLMVCTWWISDRGERSQRRFRLIWMVATAIAAFAGMALVMMSISPAETPLAFAASRRA